MDITLYQICHSPDQLSNLPPGVLGWDNSASDPKLREYPAFKQAFLMEALKYDPNEREPYWGLLSPKFEQKTKISTEKFKQWINENPGYDIYCINPCPVHEVLWKNVVLHGEYFHRGITDLINSALKEMPEYPIGDASELWMDRDSFAFCNYFVASYYFWEEYIRFVEKFISVCDNDSRLRDLLYNGNANYSHDKSLGFFPFVIERLFSIFITLCAHMPRIFYSYSYDELSHKMTPSQYAELVELSKLKFYATTNYKLRPSWELFRYNFNKHNPELFGRE